MATNATQGVCLKIVGMFVVLGLFANSFHFINSQITNRTENTLYTDLLNGALFWYLLGGWGLVKHLPPGLSLLPHRIVSVSRFSKSEITTNTYLYETYAGLSLVADQTIFSSTHATSIKLCCQQFQDNMLDFISGKCAQIYIVLIWLIFKLYT